MKAARRGPGLDQRAVHREMLLTQQIVLTRLDQHRIQQPLADRAGNQPFAVLGEYRHVPDRVVHLKAYEPAKEQVVLQLLHQLPLAANRVQHHQQSCPKQPLRRNRWTANLGIQLVELGIQPLQGPVGQRANLTRRMIQRNPLLQGYITEHRCLLLVVSAHTSYLNQIPVEKQ